VRVGIVVKTGDAERGGGVSVSIAREVDFGARRAQAFSFDEILHCRAVALMV
jgi:hypothetical protein